MVRDMLKECSRMSTFDHVNVLTLKGVCLDGGPAPYIIMPFMANGSLLAYLKKNRKSLVISSEDANGDVSKANLCENLTYQLPPPKFSQQYCYLWPHDDQDTVYNRPIEALA